MIPPENVQIEVRRPVAAIGSTEIPASHVTVDVAVLEMLLKVAASAALHVGYISDGLPEPVVIDPVADALDEIVHTLTELLGSPCVIVASAPNDVSSGFTPEVATPDRGTTHEGRHMLTVSGPSTMSERSLIVHGAVEPFHARSTLVDANRLAPVREIRCSAVEASPCPGGEGDIVRGGAS